MKKLLDQISLARLNEVCRHYHVRRLSVFGSASRGEDQDGSDLDILVEFSPGYVPGFAFISLQDELSKIFGRRVDLRTPDELSKYFRETVVREAQPIYAVA